MLNRPIKKHRKRFRNAFQTSKSKRFSKFWGQPYEVIVRHRLDNALLRLEEPALHSPGRSEARGLGEVKEGVEAREVGTRGGVG